MKTEFYKKNNDFIFHEVDNGEFVVIPVKNAIGDINSIMVINTTGHFIICLLDSPMSIKQIIEVIKKRYSIIKENEVQFYEKIHHFLQVALEVNLIYKTNDSVIKEKLIEVVNVKCDNYFDPVIEIVKNKDKVTNQENIDAIWTLNSGSLCSYCGG